MNIGIIGSRKRNTKEDLIKLYNLLTNIEIGEEDQFVSGGCKYGADSFAEIIAKDFSISIIVHYPNTQDLDPHIPYKAAYAKITYARNTYARNTLIARDSDILIAIVAEDRKGGTEDTIKKFLKKLTLTEKQAIMDNRLYILYGRNKQKN